jgi:transglutaminase-like putative cysteine protease
VTATRRRDQLLLVNEVALTVVTLAAIVGMHRLFVDGSYRGPLAAQAIVASVVVALLRRAGVHLVPAALLTAGAAVLFITWTRFPDTARWLLPTPDTLTQLGDDLSASWSLFGDVRAPAPVHNGFLAATSAAIWFIVYVADWAAFRVSATFEALLPATTLFVFAAALGGPGSPVASAAVFSGAALLYVLLHRTANQEHSSRWAGGQRAQGRWSLLGTGATIIGVAVLVGAAAGPNLPGADAEAMVAWRDLNKDTPTRVVLSPMVSLQSNLVEQSNVEVFTVRSERSSYWRLTSLDEFDGEIWRSSYSTDDADGDLPRAIDTETDSETVSQQITIEALSSVWLPAAFEPVRIEGGDDQPADIDQRSSTLMVDRDVASSDGYTYTVTSRLPVLDDDLLREASTEVPDEIADTYLQLPEGFSELAATEAFRLTGDADTPYDKAVAIQDHLRTFTYDQTVGPGHSEDALVTFLFETQRGYCEQFSAAFAALARSAGLPARVAVGFTQGVQDPNDPTLFRVRGVHAHAWPEVYLGEYGWVPFEPTPGRGPPGAESWLGITPGQDASGGDATAGDPLEGAGDGSGDPAGTGASGDDARDPDSNLGGSAATAAGAGGDSSPFLPDPVREISRPLGVGAVAYLLLVPVAVVGQRVIRRRRATTPAAKARLWWRNTTESAVSAGVALPPSLTIAEMADRLGAALPGSSVAIQDLARTMESIAYAEATPSADQVARAERAWATTVGEANRRQPWPRRILKYFDVRKLFARRTQRLVAHQGPAPNPAG